jgi:hypothetical protein
MKWATYIAILHSCWNVLLSDVPPNICDQTIKMQFLCFVEASSTLPPPSVNWVWRCIEWQESHIKPISQLITNYACKSTIVHRWSSVSGRELHNMHIGTLGHPCFSRLFAVSIFRWSRIHAKILHFDSAFARQIGLVAIFFEPALELYLLLD